MKKIWDEIKWWFGTGWELMESRQIGQSKHHTWYVNVYRNIKTQEIRETRPWSPLVP